MTFSVSLSVERGGRTYYLPHRIGKDQIAQFKAANRLCELPFPLFVPVRASSLYDVFIPMTFTIIQRRQDNQSTAEMVGWGVITVIIDLATLGFRLVALTFRAIYNSLPRKKVDWLAGLELVIIGSTVASDKITLTGTGADPYLRLSIGGNLTPIYYSFNPATEADMDAERLGRNFR